MIGQRLLHYEITDKLGEGGMGVVYKARDTHLDRFVAIKVLPPEKIADASRKARFIHEAKAASALNHPNIVHIYDISSANGVDFIAMEYVPGKTLQQLIGRKGLALNESLRYSIQIADALARAHEVGIVHRDLKPSNVMVDEHGLVKVLDFGLAKLTEVLATSDDASTQTVRAVTEEGTIVGTAAYMSPEQAEGRPVDARTDIFSFGSMLYEMLTGRQAFHGESKMSTLSAVLHQEPKPIQEAPNDLRRITNHCLRKDPERRFQNMKDVKVELEELKEESESGKLSPALVDGRKPRGWIWAASLAAAAVLVSAGGWLWWTRGGRELPPPQVVQLTSYPGSEVQPCLSPDGDKVAFTWDGGRGANLDIYVKQVGEANALRLTTDPAQDQYPVWSPDAKRVAFQRSVPGGVTSICVVTVLGATEQKLMDLRLSGPMAWSPDGKWLAVGPTAAFISEVVPSPGIYLIPAAGGEPRRITNPKPPELHKCPSFSPDGRLLAYVACSAFFACDVYIQPLDSGYVPKGTPQRITRQGLVINGLTWSRDGESLVYGGSLGAHRVRCLWRVGLRTGEPPQRLDLAGFRTAEPSIAPVGNRLVFSRELLDYDIWRYQPGGVSEPFIVSSLDEYATQFSPDGSRVVFSSLRSGEVFDIWVAKADGSNPVQLTNRMGRHQSSPSWSPDSRWIALESQGQDGQWDIYVIDATGGQPRRVTSEPSDDYLPVWSRDGKWIYFSSTRTGRNEIWRVASGGGQAEQVTRNGGYYAFESTDGKELFYLTLSSSPLFAMPLAGGPERQVLDFVAHLSVVVRQDGIYYIGRRGDDGQYPLSFFQFSTGASRLLTRISGTITNGLTLSPDGKTFLFPMSATAGADLMLVENFR